MSFLNASWKKLAIANYIIEKRHLLPYIPSGTELDIWEGKCYVSLVGFMFLDTKLLGVKIPFHTNFEEVNLRFYVKRFENGAWKRGVVFIKEIVPKRALTFIANTIYNENYETLPMEHYWYIEDDQRTVLYKWKKKGVWYSFKVNAGLETHKIADNCETAFITEHYWGYAKVNDNKTNEYEVTHPVWEVYDVNSYEINVDFAAVYGMAFEFLNHQKPHSIMLAEGSEITVESKKSI